MRAERSTLGWLGMVLGGAALLLALVHFYAGPFSPQPSLEEVVAEKAVAIKRATMAALKGETVTAAVKSRRFDADRGAHLAVAVLGGLATVLGFAGFARRESLRVAAGALCLGAGAVAFQFLTIAIGVIVLAILVAAALGSLGVS